MLTAMSGPENGQSYERTFKAMKAASFLLLKMEYSPKLIIGDGFRGVDTAVSSQCPGARRLMCYFHLMHSLRRNRGLLMRPKEDFTAIKIDVETNGHERGAEDGSHAKAANVQSGHERGAEDRSHAKAANVQSVHALHGESYPDVLA